MIRCAFPDGTTEERPATSPALLNPDNPADIHARDPRKVAPSQLGFLRDFTGSGDVFVWCLTGEAAGALTGEWRQCHAETSAEQIERLTRERDGARAVAAALARCALVTLPGDALALVRALAIAREVTRLVGLPGLNDDPELAGHFAGLVFRVRENDAERQKQRARAA